MVIVAVIRYAVVTHAWMDRPLRSSAIVRIDVLTIVWSSEARNMPSISPERIVRTWAWVYSPDAGADEAAGDVFVAIDNHRTPGAGAGGTAQERDVPDTAPGTTSGRSSTSSRNA